VKTLVGIHAVREALRATPARVQKVLLSASRRDPRTREISELARAHGVPVFKEPPQTLDRLAPGLKHQGVLAEMAPLPWLSPEELLARVPPPVLLVVLDEIEDPRNFGAIARSVDAVGGHGLLVHERGQAPPSAVAVAASAGALLHLPCARLKNIADGISFLKSRGVWVVGLSPSAPTLWSAFDYTVPVALVLGSEGRGLRPRVAGACDALVSLPVRGKVESLNVSVAAGVVLYEALRQRAAKVQL